MTIGQKLVTAYLAVAYVLPMIGNVLFHDSIVTIYKIFPLTLYSIMLPVAVYVVFLVLSTSRIRFLPKVPIPLLRSIVTRVGRMYQRLRLPFALTAVLLAMEYFSVGLNSYRYSYQGISQVNSWRLILVIILNVVISVDLFYCMFLRPKGVVKIFTRRYLENILLSLTLVLTANGTVSMFMAMTACFYSVSPKMFGRLIFFPKHWTSSRKLMRSVVLGMAILLIFPIAWLSGEAIKVSSSGHIDALKAGVDLAEGFIADEDFVKEYFHYLVASLSSHYYSLLFTAASSRDVLSYGTASPIVLPIDTLFFRADYLLGGLYQVSRPEVGSLSRLNYVLLTAEEITPRQGTSPGLIASFNYVFIFPLNVLFCSFYLRWVARIIDVLFRQRHSEALSGFGILLLLVFLQGVFQSPFDFLTAV